MVAHTESCDPLPCPSDEDLGDYLAGSLPQSQMKRIQAHISGCDFCGAMVLLQLIEGTRDAQSPEGLLSNEHAGLQIGQSLSNYRITRCLGNGAIGAVYEGIHESIGQRTAIKVLRRNPSHAQRSMKAFLEEARTASLVRHPGVVTIHNIGQLPDGAPYLMMEYLEGVSLRERLWELTAKGQRLDLVAILRIGRQIASAMAAVHAHGIVHRDLKPGNVMLVKEADLEGGERARIVDFGLARVNTLSGKRLGSASTRAADGPSDSSHPTTEALFVGTAAYAAPEQCSISQRPRCTGAADVYALGIMLYEMLTGQRPYDGEFGELLYKHQKAPVPKLPEGLAPTELKALMEQMLAKLPAQRPTMTGVEARLSSIVIPTSARKSSPIRSIISKWIRKES